MVVRVGAGGRFGLGWTYSSPATAAVISNHLVGVLSGRSPLDTNACWSAMHRACRNMGTKGLAAQAISAVDIALWDLKARLLEIPVSQLLGTVRDEVPIYGSGGFVSLGDHGGLAEQVGLWQSAGCPAMKIKIGEGRGSRIARDLARVDRLRELADADVELMVDANGGYTRGQARRVGAELGARGVVWSEEPVTSDDLSGLAVVRDAVHCDVAAGECVYDQYDAAALVDVVDCLQLDVTRCGGYTGFLRGAALATSRGLQVSAHCAPALSAPVAAAIPNLRHVEWFIDHARLEPILAEGIPEIYHGAMRVRQDEAGHGMTIGVDAADYRLA
ncbi:mandelate racemase [Nocardia sp. CDC159]|uniref:Mandelate racemase n=1 Tax=Nocardia pulmonis TaxID=2951408 RepID=A0A9X2EDY2_9NOCA|nr:MULTISPECIES: enolase C-terminal domain-like protein [Nocardia]MCM6779072.1 mandelate racemase [Nocardia pulmonis]MCM6791962.1 mandelate racemase [Nocardia sp. CDC159]